MATQDYNGDNGLFLEDKHLAEDRCLQDDMHLAEDVQDAEDDKTKDPEEDKDLDDTKDPEESPLLCDAKKLFESGYCLSSKFGTKHRGQFTHLYSLRWKVQL